VITQKWFSNVMMHSHKMWPTVRETRHNMLSICQNIC
jgi:hypothetical protein